MKMQLDTQTERFRPPMAPYGKQSCELKTRKMVERNISLDRTITDHTYSYTHIVWVPASKATCCSNLLSLSSFSCSSLFNLLTSSLRSCEFWLSPRLSLPSSSAVFLLRFLFPAAGWAVIGSLSCVIGLLMSPSRCTRRRCSARFSLREKPTPVLRLQSL